jgi:TPR repeat protein
MRIGLLESRGLALLLAGLACLSCGSGQKAKAPAPESLESLRGRAEKGDAEAQWLLGIAYDEGDGVAQDYAEAVRWYRKAAEQGEAVAQSNLGLMYDKGRGVPQDYAEAVRWYRRAADVGITDAQFNLGRMYSEGRGVPQDYIEAHVWFNLAASRPYNLLREVHANARDQLARKMPPAQIAEAQRRAREWKPKSGQESKTPAPK